MAIYVFRMRLLLFSFVCVLHGAKCMPEQGLQTLDLHLKTGKEYLGGITKSMYQHSFFSAEIRCTKGGEKIKVQWAIKTLRCAPMFKLFGEEKAADLADTMDKLRDVESSVIDGSDNYHYLLVPELEIICEADTPLTLPDYTSQTWKTFVAEPTKTTVSSDEGTSNEDDSDVDKSDDENVAAESQEQKTSSEPRKNKHKKKSKLNNNDEQSKEETGQNEEGTKQSDATKKQKRDTEQRKSVVQTTEKVGSDKGTGNEDKSAPDTAGADDKNKTGEAAESQQENTSTKPRKNNSKTRVDKSKSKDNDEPSSSMNGASDASVNNENGSGEKRVSQKEGDVPKNQSSVPPGAFVKVPVDGIYILIMSVQYDQSRVNVSVTVKALSSYGYLSAIDFPLLPFYAVMCALYSIFLLVWLFLCCYYRKDILQIQLWIGAVLFIGFVGEASFLGEYHTVNQTGQSVPGAIIFGEFVWCIKRALSRMVVIIASIGFGITKPRLGSTLPKILAVGAVYLILGSIEGYNRATAHEANQATKASMVFLIVLALTDAAICWWIFTALVQTMRTLRLRRNLVKLSLYRHFTNTLIFCILASVAFMIWTIVQRQRASCISDWKELWVDDAFWQLLFSIILLVMLILWRPSASNQRYAYSPLSDGADDEAEEPMMNDAFAGMKMRRSTDNSNSHKNSSDQMEDDLKWIDDNIPPSVADSTLPSLLDSEEEIMTTKYELSKMQ